MPDNGIMIFGPGGHKLDDATEDRIAGPRRPGPGRTPGRPGIGRCGGPPTRWTGICAVGCWRRSRLDGLKVVVDCANGAASGDRAAAPTTPRGARVIAVNAEPDGLNINKRLRIDASGTVCAGGRARPPRTSGWPHDGDADRCLAVDAAGQVADGDAIMVVLALAMH